MNKPDCQNIFFILFKKLREGGFHLGIGELLDAFVALDRNSDCNENNCKNILQLRWCKHDEERRLLGEAWESILQDPTPHSQNAISDTLPEPFADQQNQPLHTEPEPLNEQNKDIPEWTPLPVDPPRFYPEGHPIELHAYSPLSQRQMLYHWRYLRRLLPDGAADILDVEATVQRSAQQGFYLAPVYNRQRRNHAEIILLIDQGGSMVPFHRFTRQLIETLHAETGISRSEVFFFHNVPGEIIYSDPHRTVKQNINEILQYYSPDTCLMIVSDAGSARGNLVKSRFHSTIRFLNFIRQHTQLVAWLNPMPEDRWPGSTAIFIASHVWMFPMNNDGFSNAIDSLRGQSMRLSH